jgi:hypothetical protein
MRFLLILLTLAFGLSCKDLRNGYEKGFKDAFYRRFVTSCKESAAKTSGAELGSAYCECLGKHLTQKYSSTELRRITLSGKSTEMDEAAKVCSGN